MLEEFSATVEIIYAAAAGSCRWRDALIAVENLTRSAGAVIDLIPKSPAFAPKTLAGSFSEENCAEYAGSYQAICPRIRYAMQNPSLETQYDYLFMTEAQMDRDPVYEWFGRHGLRYYFGSAVTDACNYRAFVSLQRTRRQGHADKQDVRLFDWLKPHLARGVSLADQLGSLRSHQCFSSAVMDGVPQALFALDRDGTILFANSRAQAFLHAADGLCSRDGRLGTALGSEQAALDRLIGEAALVDIAASSGWARVSRPSGALPYAVFVAPLRGDDEELLAASANVLVVVHDTAQRRAADRSMLVALFGLTDAEARLASALSAGHSLESAAVSLGIREATARSELKSVFHKLRVNRQQDLVRLLTSLSSMVPG